MTKFYNVVIHPVSNKQGLRKRLKVNQVKTFNQFANFATTYSLANKRSYDTSAWLFPISSVLTEGRGDSKWCQSAEYMTHTEINIRIDFKPLLKFSPFRQYIGVLSLGLESYQLRQT